MGTKNMTEADRKRIREEANAKRKAKENKQFWILCSITLVVALVIFLIPVIRSAATLPKEIRNVEDIQDNWLVIDTDDKLSKRYHHPASLDIPEGFTKGEFTKYNDGVAQDFFLLSGNPDALVYSLYVDATPNLSAQEYIQRMVEQRENALNSGSAVTAGEPFTATVSGKKAHCLYLRYTTTSGDYGCLVCGFDAPRNVCVTAAITGNYTTAENVQTQEQLLQEAQTLLAGLTIVK